MRRYRYRSGTSGILIGGVIVLIGLLLLLDNLGIVVFHDVWRYWPVLLIVWGVSRILDCVTPAGYVWGGIVALVGAFLLLDNLDILSFNLNLIWPILLIAFGVSMLLRSMERKRILEGSPPFASTGVTAEPTVGIYAIFSGSKRKIDAQDFKGGDVLAIFGGVHIDLRKAAITADRAVIDVNAIFGGVEIRVPEEWSVVMKGMGVFGGFEDKTIHHKIEPNVKTPELVVTGSAIFGGAKVEN